MPYDMNKLQKHAFVLYKNPDQETTHYMILFIWNIQKKQICRDREYRLVTSWAGEGWVRQWWEWEFFGGEGKSAKIVLCLSLYNLINLLKYCTLEMGELYVKETSL